MEEKYQWKRSYNYVLILNALYILIFFILMEVYS